LEIRDRIGVLGGTFDPIHLGHLDMAREAQSALDLNRVILLPARVPPRRSAEPRASAFHRFAMASMAAAEQRGIVASDLELQREGPSYTSSTLERLHADGLSPSQLYFILGADAFSEIATWHDYPRLLDLSNFVVISRPGFSVTQLAARIPASATGIFYLIGDTPDVSSTDIRRRIGAGESIDGLVPRSVAAHIERHRLYVPASVAAL
jgi:nicotinate-nucleotide adenylyltransferase